MRAPAKLPLTLLVLAGAALVLEAQEAPRPEPVGLAALQPALHAMAQAAAPATLLLSSPDRSEQIQRTATWLGDGLAITDILNLSGLPEQLELADWQGRTRRARILGQDRRLRLALLQIDGPPGPSDFAGSLRRERSREPGRIVLCCGRGDAPLGPPLVSLGNIAASSRFAGLTVQLAADMNPALAGGPVIGLDGAALGVAIRLPARSMEDAGIAFFVPWEVLEPALPALMKGQSAEPGSLGIMVPEADRPGTEGVLVIDVIADGPAAKAGLRRGDLILQIGEVEIRNLRELTIASAQWIAGKSIKLKFRRTSSGGESEEIEVEMTAVSRKQAPDSKRQ